MPPETNASASAAFGLSPAVLDVAIELICSSRSETISTAGLLLVAQNLKAGARISEKKTIRLINHIYRDVTELRSCNPVYCGLTEALIESMVQSDWNHWTPETLARTFKFLIFSLRHRPDHLDEAVECVFSSYQHAQFKQSTRHTESHLDVVVCRAMKILELSFARSQDFYKKMRLVLLSTLTIDNPLDHVLFSLILNSNPRFHVYDQPEASEETSIANEVDKKQTMSSILLECDVKRLIEHEDRKACLKTLLERQMHITSIRYIGIAPSPIDLAAKLWSLTLFKGLWTSIGYRKLRNWSPDQVDRVTHAALVAKDMPLVNFLLGEICHHQIPGEPLGQSLLVFTLYQDNSTALILLLEEYAQVPSLLSIRDLALHIATRPEVSSSMLTSLLNTEKIPHCKDACGSSPIHLLAGTPGDLSAEKLGIMISYGIPLDNVDEDCSTPLDVAIRCSNFRAIKLLLDAEKTPQTVKELEENLGIPDCTSSYPRKGRCLALPHDPSRIPQRISDVYGHRDSTASIRNMTHRGRSIITSETIVSETMSDVERVPTLKVSHTTHTSQLEDENAADEVPSDDCDCSTSAFQPNKFITASEEGNKNYVKTPSEQLQTEVAKDVCQLLSSGPEFSSTHAVGNQGRFSSKREFQKFDSRSLEPPGKRSRAV
ncbi:hypothetical protein BKA64DRAFT_359042 [Cadophora sp. MPI-SDFR-AT-0126]|nr:hypothetical protein BKA64DRAFT_359042 [Leotiomycetes sp. MPI-SDFR-AT-0126]